MPIHGQQLRMMLRFYQACIFTALSWLLSSAAMASVISKIEFVGNEHTREHVLLQEMQSKIGMPLDIKTIKADVQAIMDLELFREVTYHLFADEQASPDSVRLVIEVTEKYYFFVLPEIRFDEEDRAFRYGMRVYWDNINGHNHSLRLKVLEKGKTEGVRAIEQKFEYHMPRIQGSPYQLQLYASYSEEALISSLNPVQFHQRYQQGVDLLRWLNPQHRSSGWFVGGGLFTERRENEALYAGDVSRPDYSGDFWGIRAGYKKVNQYLYNRRGKDFGYKLDTTQVLFDTDENFTRQELYYRSYYRLKSQPMNNLNVQVRLGVSDGDFLGETEYRLGGRLLRGYEKNAFNGNALLVMNLEYLTPFERDPAYRYGLLFDIGNAYPSFKTIDLQKLHPAIGVGFRWKLAAFVKVDLRLDIGYGIDTDTYNVLLNSRHAF